jgi:integrase
VFLILSLCVPNVIINANPHKNAASVITARSGGVTHPSQTQPRTINLLRQDELKRLFAAIRSKRDCALFLLAYRHGLRAAEVGLLHVSDVD